MVGLLGGREESQGLLGDPRKLQALLGYEGMPAPEAAEGMPQYDPEFLKRLAAALNPVTAAESMVAQGSRDAEAFPGQARAAGEALANLWNDPRQLLSTPTAQAIKSGVTLPGDVYAGRQPMGLPSETEDLSRVADLAGLAMTGGMGAAGATGAGAGGATLGVVPIPVARRLEMPVRTGSNEMLAAAVPNTPRAQLTPDGLQMAVQRYQKPEQALEESVRTGVFYLPAEAPQAKYYRNHRPTEQGTYGGVEKIEGDTLYKDPLVVKGGTGGKAPEAAYDQLLGKGAYQKMRDDAITATAPGWARLEHQDKVSLVERFLKEYAPENADMAEHILQNSRGGNLLPYALQELAVAKAVRDAGHDAVIGITKSKGNPILSEVFDVRESHYPSADGGFELNPKFQGLLRDDVTLGSTSTDRKGAAALSQGLLGNREPIRALSIRPRDGAPAEAYEQASGNIKGLAQDGHLYRGMTQAEFENTVGSGRGVKSTGAHSHSSEGTSFTHEPEVAESYVNYGRDDPRKTGKPNYIVEVRGQDGFYKDRDGYFKSKDEVSPDRITRVWKMDDNDGEIVATLVRDKPPSQ